MRRLSIAWRVRLLSMAAVGLLFGAVAVPVYRQAQSVYREHLDRLLEVMTRGVATAWPAEGEPDAATLERLTASPWKGPRPVWRAWEPATGRAQDSGGADVLRELSAGLRPQAGELAFFDLADKRKHYRVAWLRHEGPAGAVEVQIAHPSGYEQRRLAELGRSLAVSGAVAVAVAGLVLPALVGRAIRPARRLAERIRREEPPGAAVLPRELAPLADAVAEQQRRTQETRQRYRQFASDVSHELRTPLALARSTLELAVGDPQASGASRQAIQEALAGLDRMGELIDQWLTLARLERAQVLGEGVEIRLDAALEELAVRMEGPAAAKSIRIVCRDLPPVIVRGQEPLLGRLFGNILDNAIEHGPADGTITIRLEYGPEGRCTALIEDEGGGLVPEMMPHLFERHYRGLPGSAGRGAGLGLTLAREIARLHGGDLWATASPARRTTFHVELPCGVGGAE